MPSGTMGHLLEVLLRYVEDVTGVKLLEELLTRQHLAPLMDQLLASFQDLGAVCSADKSRSASAEN